MVDIWREKARSLRIHFVTKKALYLYNNHLKQNDMTVLERKAKLVTAILTDTDDARFAEMEKFYKSLKKKQISEPCMYTIEEIRAGLPKIEKEFTEGKGISHEEVMKEYGL